LYLSAQDNRVSYKGESGEEGQFGLELYCWTMLDGTALLCWFCRSSYILLEVCRGELLVAAKKHVRAAKSFAAAAVVRDDEVRHVRSVQLFATHIAGCKLSEKVGG
jgi:hypothetical protein